MSWLQDYLRSHFTQHVLNPQLWIMTAKKLMSAAERLAQDIEQTTYHTVRFSGAPSQFWTNLEALDEGVSFPLSAMTGSHYQDVFMMLHGFAIENFCKGYAVTRLSAPELLMVHIGKLPGRLKTHKLEHLVTKEIGLALDEGEKELLRRLEAAVVWAGRYPVSTGPMDQKKQELKEQLLAMPQGLRGDDVARTRLLTDRIKTHVCSKVV